MAVYTIQAPDGRKIKVEADTEADAINGVKQYVVENPAETAPAPIPEPQAPPQVPQEEGGYGEGYFAQGTSGVNEGIAATLGLPVDIVNNVLRLGAHGLKTMGGPDIQLPVDAVGGSQSIRAAMGGAIQPETDDPGKQFVRRVGQELGASAVPIASTVSKAARPVQSLVTQGLVAAGSGAGAGAAKAIDPDNPYLEMAGQILGGGLVAGGIFAAQKAITPNRMSAVRRKAVQTMTDEGVELSGGQRVGSRNLQFSESELGGGAAQALNERQAEQFTRAALSKAGIGARRATPDVMDDAFRTIGAQFDDIGARNTLIPDRQMVSDLRSTVTQYADVVNDAARAPVIKNFATDLVGVIRSGQMSGAKYSEWQRRLGKLARSAKGDPMLAEALRGFKSTLDDAMERSIAANNPADLGVWQSLRTDYRNMLVIETAASRAGVQATSGIITPANLRSAVAIQGKRAYVRGQGDFSELARAGVETMTPLPDSGTASRMSARALQTAVPSTVGAIVGAPAGIPGSIAGAAAGAALPKIAGRAMLSGPGRAYLSNQAWTTPLNLSAAGAGPALSALGQQNYAVSNNNSLGPRKVTSVSMSELRALEAQR